MITSYYAGLEIPAAKIKRYLRASNLFTLLLTDGEIIHFTPFDVAAFTQWLLTEQVEDLRMCTIGAKQDKKICYIK